MHPCLKAALASPNSHSLDVMRLSLVDWISVGWAGRNEEVTQLVRALTLEDGGAEHASLFGGGRAPVRAAALVNGTASHALDYDDTHFAHIGHPSVVVLSAAMALAERQGASLESLLRAALAGCEASVRFGLLFGRRHYQVGFHQTATAGAFGATVAAMQMLKGNETQTHQAIALVSTRASGLKSQFGTMGKPYNAGIAAANGVESALLAHAGFVSSDTALDGPLGFLDTHHCDGELDETPGFLMDSISHKYHACCHGLHATLEALEKVLPVDVGDITTVQIKTHPRWMSVCNKANPTTGLEAKFSYAGVVAARLLGHDTARLETFEDALWRSPEITALQKRIEVNADDTLTEMQAEIEVQTSSGAHQSRHDLADTESFETRADRIRSKSAALLGQGRATRLWNAVHNTQTQADDLAQFMA